MVTKIKDFAYDTKINEEKQFKSDSEPYGMCKICNDKASGMHYGVATCEGCKGFYKRTIAQKRTHRCLFNNNCEVKANSRRKCKACRFKKCLALGMTIEGVKLGRLPLFQKVKLLQTSPVNEIKKEQEILDNSNETPKVSPISDFKQIPESQINKQNTTAKPGEDLFDYLIKDFGKEDDAFKDIIQNNSSQPQNEVDIVRQTIESHLDKIDFQKTGLINIYDRENFLRKFFNFQSFFQVNPKFFEAANILTKTTLEELYFTMENENILFFFTVARDKCHFLYNQLIKPIDKLLELANEFKRNNTEVKNVSKEEAWNAYKNYIKNLAGSFVSFAKELPGFDKMCQHDFTSIVEANISIFFAFSNTKLHKDNDFFIVFGDVVIDRYLMSEFFGTSIYESFCECSANIKSLNLTNQEISLLLPFIITSSNAPLVDESFIKDLNLNYARALLYEFSLSNRDALFMNNVIQVIGMIKTSNRSLTSISDPFL